jgi:hypothetical protein
MGKLDFHYNLIEVTVLTKEAIKPSGWGEVFFHTIEMVVGVFFEGIKR